MVRDSNGFQNHPQGHNVFCTSYNILGHNLAFLLRHRKLTLAPTVLNQTLLMQFVHVGNVCSENLSFPSLTSVMHKSRSSDPEPPPPRSLHCHAVLESTVTSMQLHHFQKSQTGRQLLAHTERWLECHAFFLRGWNVTHYSIYQAKRRKQLEKSSEIPAAFSQTSS